jgi:galactokinase
MDQAISIFAEAGYAKKIDFHPNLSLENVLLPEKIVLENGVEDNICWVITDSLVESQKAISARKCFNKRVVECRLSCALLAHLIGVDVENTRTFAELLRASPKHSLEDLIQIVHSNFKQSAYSLEQLKTNINYNVKIQDLKIEN